MGAIGRLFSSNSGIVQKVDKKPAPAAKKEPLAEDPELAKNKTRKGKDVRYVRKGRTNTVLSGDRETLG